MADERIPDEAVNALQTIAGLHEFHADRLERAGTLIRNALNEFDDNDFEGPIRLHLDDALEVEINCLRAAALLRSLINRVYAPIVDVTPIDLTRVATDKTRHH